MSLRTLNTVLGRKDLQSSIQLFQGYVEYVASRSDGDDEDDYDFSSLSSDDDDDDDDSDSGIVCMNDLILPLAKAVLENMTLIYQQIEDETITFGQKKKIEDFTDSECLADFRFRKVHLTQVADELWPRLSPVLGNNREDLVLENKYHAPFETCLLLYLFKASRPRRLCPDCEQKFGMRKSHLSVMIRSFGSALFNLAQQYLTDPRIWQGKMAYYGERVSTKCEGLFSHIWRFIDGTIRKTCRPNVHQNLLYTRYKKCHGVKFQSVVTPDGFIASLYRPFVAKRHDARMLRESSLIEMLENLMPANLTNGPMYTLYGDLAYPQTIWSSGCLAAS